MKLRLPDRWSMVPLAALGRGERWLVPALALMGALLLGGAHLLANTVIDRLLRKDAETTGTLWARDFAARLPDLPRVLEGAPPSQASHAFMLTAREVGSVFRFKLFDGQGRQVLVSDKLDMVAAGAERLDAHNPQAAGVLTSGRPHSELKAGKPPDRPPVYVETYVPVVVGGRVIAVTEVYIDQTEKQAIYRSHMAYASLALVGLTALSFAIPAAAFFWRSRQKHHADARISFLARHDPMTGLVNRAAFVEALAGVLAARRTRGTGVAVHYIDVDRFKDVNDTLGHDVGDELVRQMARRLAAIADPGDMVARIGGDEFAIVQAGAASLADAERLAQQLVAAVATPCRARGHEIATSASIGVLFVASDEADGAIDAVTALKRADIAMYRAKAAGRNRFCLFAPEMDGEVQERRHLEQLIREATAHETFEVHFQPLVRAGDGAPVAFEALLRLPQAAGGYVSPTEFIPVAEDLGLISNIGAWVLSRACAVAARWPEHVHVAVNLSPAQFADGSVVGAVRAALQSSGIAPSRLELEITEGLLMRKTDAVVRDLLELKALGAAIVMDDFGTGYSSLSYLWRFPFNKIKIDRSFVNALSEGDASVSNIVRTIVALGHSLQMRVTAEGVETAAQAQILRGLGCDQLQGFLFARPQPEGQVGAAFERLRQLAEGPARRPPASPAARPVAGTADALS